MIRLTETREIAPYLWVGKSDEVAKAVMMLVDNPWTPNSIYSQLQRLDIKRKKAARRLVEIGLKAKLKYRAGGAEDEGGFRWQYRSALSARTFGHASHSSVRRIGPSTSAFLAGVAMGRSGSASSVTGISATPISDKLVSQPD
jgi:hypothetical protein